MQLHKMNMQFVMAYLQIWAYQIQSEEMCS